MPDLPRMTALSEWVVRCLPALAPDDEHLAGTIAIAQRWLNLGTLDPPPAETSINGQPVSWFSTPEIKTRLIDLIREMEVRPLGKNPKLRELSEWVLRDLPALAPNDPRTPMALALAAVGLERSYI